MFCRYCGKEIPDTAKFCRYCGKNLEAAEGKQTVQQPEKQMVRQSEKQPEKKKNVVLLILCVVLALLLVAVVGLTVIKIVNDNISSDRQEEQEQRDRDDRDRRKETDKEDKEGKEEDNLPMEGTEAGMPEHEESASASQAESETPEEMVLEAPQEVETVQYILPESNSRFLTKDDLEGLTQEECRLARNELFARHGRIFQDESLRTYFESLEWYHGTVLPEDFDESVFNEYEFANRDLIVEYEKEQGYR